jgi:LPXTG-site transpeptidase (sortase) family protein
MKAARGIAGALKRVWESRTLPVTFIAGGVCLMVTGTLLALVFAKVPAIVLEHPGAGASAPQQALATLANRLEEISPYARQHVAPARPRQARTGLWIEIPSVGIGLPVEPGDGSDNIPYWQALWYPGTAAPGSAGNSYIYAHGIWGMFGGLLFLHDGDHVYLHDYSAGTRQDFVVSKVVGDVAYNDVHWLKATSSSPLLTLQTCIGWDVKGDRYVVLAVPAGGSSQ